MSKHNLTLAGVVALSASIIALLYFSQGWSVGSKLDNATSARFTLAHTDPYALAITASDGVRPSDRQAVEDRLQAMLDEQGFALVDAQSAVNDGGSVLTVQLDGTQVGDGSRTFAVGLRVTAYVYRLGSSGDYYRQASHLYAEDRHGFARVDVLDEAMSTTAAAFVDGFLQRHRADNPDDKTLAHVPPPAFQRISRASGRPAMRRLTSHPRGDELSRVLLE